MDSDAVTMILTSLRPGDCRGPGPGQSRGTHRNLNLILISKLLSSEFSLARRRAARPGPGRLVNNFQLDSAELERRPGPEAAQAQLDRLSESELSRAGPTAWQLSLARGCQPQSGRAAARGPAATCGLSHAQAWTRSDLTRRLGLESPAPAGGIRSSDDHHVSDVGS